MNFLELADWKNEPELNIIKGEKVIIQTDPGTDLWQRSFYGFRNDNAPLLQAETAENFTFSCRVDFKYKGRFDQCGVVVYLDSENWFKASIEYENDQFSRLGSVVTNRGYSDWATTDIQTPSAWYYRLSRRGPDFLIDSCPDGISWKQMRIFHLHMLGETTRAMGQADPPLPPENKAAFGIYACSPLESSFKAEFTQLKVSESLWEAHA
ncbi:MAG: DUF1349 domain-containing protein [Spirochaetales bacterium]|nr:DUF1349 domain-containing protein [Spirochaetales bacterium]